MKKLNQKGFSHHLVMFAILALVLGAMGFAGYRIYQNRNIDAKAGSFTNISSTQYGAAYVCKTIVTGAYGSIYTVKMYAKNNGSYPISGRYRLFANNKYNTTGIVYKNGTSGVVSVTGTLTNNKVQVDFLGSSDGNRFVGSSTMTSIAAC